MSILHLEQLSKTYRNGVVALDQVNLSVAAGEIVALVGPSGCGKSTLLRLIAGLDTPSTGSIWYQGQEITRQPAEQRGMGLVFQNYALFPHMNVAENIGFGLRVRGVPRAQRQQAVAAIMEQLQIGSLAQRRPDQLSGGQQQRVALGRALAIKPRLLLLDEPLTALDAQLRETLRSELRRTLDQFGITSIYVTHDQAEALSLGDRVAVMRAGRIEQIGTPREIYQQLASSFVAQFIGTSNQLPGTIRLGAGGPQVETPLSTQPFPVVTNSASFTEGAPVTLLIRPEDLLLCPPEEGQIVATVARFQFLGDRLRLFLHAANHPPELVADINPHSSITIGSAVSLRIRRAIPFAEMM